MRKPIKYLLMILFIAISSLSYAQGPYNANIVVTKTADEDPFMTQDVVDGVDTDPVHIALVEGTLQWAIRKANKDVGADHIVFSDNLDIKLGNNLPLITDEIFIDGTNHSTYIMLTDMVKISREVGTPSWTAFDIIYNAPNSIIKGIYIHSFGVATQIRSVNNVVIEDNIINRMVGPGILITSPDARDGKVMSIKNNIIGTDLIGTPTLGNQTGIFIWAINGNLESIQIGGTNLNERNIIRNNLSMGIAIDNARAKFNSMRQNEIYDNGSIWAIRLINGSNQNKPKPIISSISPTGNVVGTAQVGDLVEIFGSTGNQNANKYLTTVTADASGNWSASLGVLPWSYITATATDFTGKNAPELENTSELSIAHAYPIVTPCPIANFFISGELCVGEGVSFINTTPATVSSAVGYSWNLGDGSPLVTSYSIQNHIYNEPGTYTVTLTVFDAQECNSTFSIDVEIIDCFACEHCIGSFAPLKEKKYVLSAWVKEKNVANPSEQFKTYTGPEIILNFTSTSTTIGPFKAKGQIIDGWQRMEEEFIIPLSATDIVVKLNNSAANEVYFDDIRIHPFDANMKSFVYDPITLKLVAELDGNNYATFYEYDEEGKLIRVKKETERGIKTIQESREHTVK